MPVQTVSIELDIPEGYEFVEFRKLSEGDTHTDGSGSVYIVDFPGHRHSFIIKKSYSWPDFIKSGWYIAANYIEHSNSYEWKLYDCKPTYNTRSLTWQCNGGVVINLDNLNMNYPECGDSSKSLIQKP